MVMALQRTAGNQAVVHLLRKEAPDIKAIGQAALGKAQEGPPTDAVDAFLESRRSLYKVQLVGLQLHVSISRSYKWTARYTNRALTENAVGAAINAIYMAGNRSDAGLVRKAWERVVPEGVKYEAASTDVKDQRETHLTIIGQGAMRQIADILNLPPKFMVDRWRAKYGEARMIEFALRSAYTSFDQLVPQFRAKDLAASQISVEMIRHLLDKLPEQMIEVAKRHPAARSWREAYKRNLALYWDEREPVLEDFDKVPLADWARTLLQLAVATRKTAKELMRRQWQEDRKADRNAYLRPHELKVDDAAKFILENFEPTHEVRLEPNPWVIRGGMHLTNIKDEPIFLIRVEGHRVIFQNLGDLKLYEQTLDGFSQEQLYGIYAAAGRKSLGAISLSKWVISIAGAVFPPVRYGLLATDILNAAFKLQQNRAELERTYDGLKVAYENIDNLVPGVLPRVWDAVLDKEAVLILNPLKNPDHGAWLKVVIRLVMARQARVVNASYAAEAVTGFLRTAWAAIKKGLGVLLEIVTHIIILAPAVAGSTGVSGQRALDLAEKKLKDLGVLQAAAIALQFNQLPDADKQRLAREIDELVDNGTKLVDVVKRSLSW